MVHDFACVISTVCLTSHFLLAGLAGYGTQICMTYALKFAKAAPAIAMSYLSVVWGLLGGLFFFHEVCLLHKFPLNLARYSFAPLYQNAYTNCFWSMASSLSRSWVCSCCFIYAVWHSGWSSRCMYFLEHLTVFRMHTPTCFMTAWATSSAAALHLAGAKHFIHLRSSPDLQLYLLVGRLHQKEGAYRYNAVCRS